MNFALRLSCILALLFCLASTGSAGAIDRDRQKLRDLQRRSEGNTDPDLQMEITNEVVEIYKKYRGQADSNAADEADLNAKVENFEKTRFVEGVPMQGGAFWDFVTNILVTGSVKDDAVKLAKSSSKALVDGIAAYLLNKLWQGIGLGK